MRLSKHFVFLIMILGFVNISGSDGIGQDLLLKIGTLHNKTPYGLNFVDRCNEGEELFLKPLESRKIDYEVVNSQAMGHFKSADQFKEQAQFYVETSGRPGGYNPAHDVFLSIGVDATDVTSKKLRLMRLYELNRAVYAQSSSFNGCDAVTVDYKFTEQSSNAMVSIEPTNSGHITSIASLLKCSPTVTVHSYGCKPQAVQSFSYSKREFKQKN